MVLIKPGIVGADVFVRGIALQNVVKKSVSYPLILPQKGHCERSEAIRFICPNASCTSHPTQGSSNLS